LAGGQVRRIVRDSLGYLSLVIAYVTCPHDNMRAPGPRIQTFPSHRSPNARVRLLDSAGLAAFPRIRESSWDSHSAP
jgi:hypothetical protein